jgi:hypothetical protein
MEATFLFLSLPIASATWPQHPWILYPNQTLHVGNGKKISGALAGAAWIEIASPKIDS